MSTTLSSNPFAFDDSATTDEDNTVLLISVLANDSDPDTTDILSVTQSTAVLQP